jgi:hypothetical protein
MAQSEKPFARRSVTLCRTVLGGVLALVCSSWFAAGAGAGALRLEEEDGVSNIDNPPTDSRYQRMSGKSGTAAGWLRLPDAGRGRYAQDIREISERYGMSPVLVEAVIRVESAFNPLAVSRKGARGLMQLMPATAYALGVQNSFDPRENIDGGVRHLRHLIDRYPGDLPLVLAAYNAGEGAVDYYGGIPPYPETRQYVQKVLQHPGLTAAVIRRYEDRGGKPTIGGAPVTDLASGIRRLTLLPVEQRPALPLIDEARRSGRATLPGLVTSTLGKRLDTPARSSDRREPISRMLARMRQQGLLSDQAREGSAPSSRPSRE